MLSRRQWLRTTALAATALPLLGARARAEDALITRAVPASGEQLPIVGLGSSATFSRQAGAGEEDRLRAVLEALFEGGGRVFDTAPAYGDSEAVAGRLVGELGARDQVFWATKLNAAPRGGGAADPDRARAQVETSFERIDKSPIDLIQVHNVADVENQLGLLKDYKAAGRLRYIGVTNTRSARYDDLEAVMRSEPLDFIGIDYAVDNRHAADRLLPLAADRGIGVLVYAPFGRTRLWKRVAGREVPAWAAEFGATSWARFFLKFAAAHPAVTVVTPATSKPEHMRDNLGAARGTLPDEATRRRMVDLVEALPQA